LDGGSQAPDQAQNLAETLKEVGSDTTVTIGLREGSLSFEAAKLAGFSVNNGTLSEMFQVIRQSNFVILLISCAAQAMLYKDILAALKPGATLGLSHGISLGYLDSIGATFPENIDVIAVCAQKEWVHLFVAYTSKGRMSMERVSTSLL
jgi:ketol-acid reductoisomerase